MVVHEKHVRIANNNIFINYLELFNRPILLNRGLSWRKYYINISECELFEVFFRLLFFLTISLSSWFVHNAIFSFFINDSIIFDTFDQSLDIVYLLESAILNSVVNMLNIDILALKNESFIYENEKVSFVFNRNYEVSTANRSNLNLCFNVFIYDGSNRL